MQGNVNVNVTVRCDHQPGKSGLIPGDPFPGCFFADGIKENSLELARSRAAQIYCTRSCCADHHAATFREWQMWTDISQFDIPDHQKMTACGPGRSGKFTEIGEVCVVNSISGRAKVRAIHPRKKRSLVWPLAALAATGMAAIVWLEQDIPKPPEPMRIIVRSVASEGTVQASSQTLQAAPTSVNKTPAPAKPQTSSGAEAKATVAAKSVAVQPSLSPVKSEPAKTVPAAKPLLPVKPQTAPLAAGNVQAKNPAVVQQAAKPPTAIQPAVQPVAAKPAAPVIKNEKPVIAPVTEPLPENNTGSIAPASNEPPPDQNGTQP